ncbi:MAG: beta-lactamase family protein [Anaerolineaceae bacterium]|nr:beta-lactamase family protein [Anaerolineaceae bacterium]
MTDNLLTAFSALIESEMDYYHIPGMAAVVIADGEIVYTQGFGVRDLESGAPFTTTTRFRIGSTTKSMTSLLVAQLVDEGLLDWDTPVTAILPDFATVDPALTAQITVRDLMGMATGLESDVLPSFDWGAWSVSDLLAAVAVESQAGEFRQYYAYNNEVYALAGYAAVAAAGQEPSLSAYTALLQERLFAPVGMTSTLVTDDTSQLGDNFAYPYDIPLTDDTLTPVRTINPAIGVVAPSGGIWSTVEDMGRYLITQMNGGVTPDGGRIVSAESLAETWKPGVPLPDDVPLPIADMAYGMGWVTLNYQGIPVRYHDGGWTGYYTQMVVFPDANVGLILFANSTVGALSNESLVYGFGELLYGLEPQAAEVIRSLYNSSLVQLGMVRTMIPATTLDAETDARLMGDYEGGWQVAWHADGTLWLVYGDWTFQIVPFPIGGENAYLVINNGAAGTLVTFDVENDPVALVIQLPDGEIRLDKLP